MPRHSDEHLRQLARYSGDPWISENPYFAAAEPFMDDAWNRLIYPVVQDCDFTLTLDLAAGHGRNSVYLLRYSDRLHLMDIQEANVEICRRRFAGYDEVLYYVNNGYNFDPRADASLTFIYCFDSMVHFEPEVIESYLADARRVLRSGGRGFFHHSNYTGGLDWRQNPHSRNFMSRELFARLAVKAGLCVLRQRTIDWAECECLDCLTLVGLG